MSSTLYWEPVQPERGEALSYAMKKTISRYLWDTDGSVGGEPATLTAKDIAVLMGMALAGSDEIKKDVRILIEAIEKYGAVRLWHEH
jgi:hypothetical protein